VIDMKSLQSIAAEYKSHHVRKFAPIIGTLLQTLRIAGVPFERHYTRQVLIASRWIGKYEHPRLKDRVPSRIVIVDRRTKKPVIEIYNENDAKLFVDSVQFAKQIMQQRPASHTG